MKKVLWLLLICVLSVPRASAANPALGAAMQLQEAFAEVASKAKPAVVNISTVYEGRVQVPAPPSFFFGDPEDMFQQFWGQPPYRTYKYKSQGTGSGFIIDARGYVLTNYHVVEGANEIQVARTLADGKIVTHPGRVIGRDPTLDLAVIKIDSKETFPHLGFADSSKLRVGEWAIAIGSPFSLEQTVTAGIISAVRQSLTIEGRRYTGMIQTDAAINRGNSGGPLLNLRGEVIGINTAIYSPSGASAGIGFAIASNEAKTVLDVLLAGKSRGWIGVEAAPVDEVIRRRFALPSAQGVLVNAVFKGSPAEKAGIRRGDVIFSFDGTLIKAPQDLVAAAAHKAAGQKVELELYRRGAPLTVKLTLGRRPEEGRLEPAGPPAAEEEAAPRAKYTWEGVEFGSTEHGVRVENIRRDSPLFGFLKKDDIVRGLGDVSIESLDDLKRAAAKSKPSEGLFLDIVRNGQEMYLSIK